MPPTHNKGDVRVYIALGAFCAAHACSKHTVAENKSTIIADAHAMKGWVVVPTPTASAVPPPANHSVLPKTQVVQVPDGVVLTAGQESGCAISFIVIFAILWNAIVWPSALVSLAVSVGLGAAGFSIPEFRVPLIGALLQILIVALFCGAGIWLAFRAWRSVRIKNQLTSAELHVSRWPLRLGDTATVSFRRGASGSIQIQQIEGKLRCYESARYSVGTDTRTITEDVYSLPLPTYPAQPGVKQHIAVWQIQIPQHAPPSFATSDNSLVWSVDVVLQAKNFPVPASFVLTVLPEVV